MATDKTPPRNRLIATIALITLCTLVALKFILTSYFDQMIEADKATKRSKPEELWAVHAEQRKSLQTSPKPIEVAMKEMSNPVRSDVIAPKQSDDTGPLLGWSKSPKALPKPQMAIAPVPTATAPQADGGVLAADAGEAAAADAGTPAPHAPTPTQDGGRAP